AEHGDQLLEGLFRGDGGLLHGFSRRVCGRRAMSSSRPPRQGRYISVFLRSRGGGETVPTNTKGTARAGTRFDHRGQGFAQSRTGARGPIASTPPSHGQPVGRAVPRRPVAGAVLDGSRGRGHVIAPSPGTTRNRVAGFAKCKGKRRSLSGQAPRRPWTNPRRLTRRQDPPGFGVRGRSGRCPRGWPAAPSASRNSRIADRGRPPAAAGRRRSEPRPAAGRPAGIGRGSAAHTGRSR